MGRMELGDHKIEVEEEHRHAHIFIYNQLPLFEKEAVPAMVDSLNHVLQVVAQKHGVQPIFVDVNNYRKEREKLLSELARAAARKALATKEQVTLPMMNSYERRIIHTELAMHPEVTTESQGMGRGRHVIVKTVE